MEHGVEQVMRWRRTYGASPPPLEANDPFQQTISEDERYRDLELEVPLTESLETTTARVSAVWEESIAPALREGRNVMVVSHGNTLRALVKLVDCVSDEDSFYLDLPTACPVVYDLDADLAPIEVHGVWGESSTARHGRFLMSESLVTQAQDAMRRQCLQNIAVSTVDGLGQSMLDISDAVTSDAFSQRQVMTQDGRTYNVRERPPTYFAQESRRIQSRAKEEVSRMRSQLPLSASPAVNPAVSSAEKARVAPAATLVVLRHGYSDFNRENLFTGWVDCDLTNRGKEEARFAGSLLREAGVVRLERVYTSFLKRAIKTAWLMLDELELQWVPVSHSWRLNERHYGALQGQPKKLCSERYGVEQVQKWRRGIRHPPPEWTEEMAAAVLDRRYAEVRVPCSESLADCTQRLLPFLEEDLWPAMREAVARAAAEAGAQEQQPANEPTPSTAASRRVPAFAVASSENLIRALVAHIEGVSEEEIPLLDIPYATPLVYHFDADLQLIPSDLSVRPLRHGYYLGDAERIRKVQQDIRDSVALQPGVESACYAEVGADGELEWVCNEPQPPEDLEGLVHSTEAVGASSAAEAASSANSAAADADASR